eukprot:CAMPEP_0204861322 /NCGR_PEP_ID=MMETSP1348-20121228/1477_1 /ASSEMBLY_ACC=CAM_ASM_000700 /TAXON_ID=215587 /ORGANISM="Aplanochytrium stocchinoi, Strain GSBS06" /LENGTH=186 /DNA_ID=CAMNT_0052010653 /DNA_START=144 /DNA_END=704 /DNA_ORIENTATION=-
MYSGTTTTPGAMNLDSNTPQPGVGYLNLNKGIAPSGGRESTDMVPYSMTMNLSNGGAAERESADKFPDSLSANYSKPGTRASGPTSFPDSVNLSNRKPVQMPPNNAFPDSVNLSNGTGAAPIPNTAPPPNTGRESTDMVPFSVTMNFSTGKNGNDPFPLGSTNLSSRDNDDDIDDDNDESTIHDII